MGGKVEGWYMPKFRACRQSSVYLVQAGDRVKSSTQDDVRLMEPPLPPSPWQVLCQCSII